APVHCRRRGGRRRRLCLRGGVELDVDRRVAATLLDADVDLLGEVARRLEVDVPRTAGDAEDREVALGVGRQVGAAVAAAPPAHHDLAALERLALLVLHGALDARPSAPPVLPRPRRRETPPPQSPHAPPPPPPPH